MDRIDREVRRELGRFGTGAGLPEVLRAWTAAAGPTIARNAFPARVSRDGVLHVATTSSLWAFELAQLAETLLGRLRTHLGDLAPRAVRFAVGPVPEPPPEPSGAAVPVEPDAAERDLAARLVVGIDDEELRALVRRAAALSLARAASDRRF